MPVLTQCTHCGKQYRVNEDRVGRPFKCPNCGKPFLAAVSSAPSASELQLLADAVVATSDERPRAPIHGNREFGFVEYDDDAADTGVYREGKHIVMRPGARLPAFCVHTNGPADGDLQFRDMKWHPPEAYVGLFLGVIPFIIWVLCTTKKASIVAPISSGALDKRRALIVGTWLCFSVGLGTMLFVLKTFYDHFTPLLATLFIASCVLLITATCLAHFSSTILLRVKKMDHEFVWLVGAHPGYLARLREL